MLFTKEMFTYIPPELKDDFFAEDVDETEEELNHAEEAHSGGGGTKWHWGPDGENSPEYNHWYWMTHKDRIMERRAELAREREAAARENGAYRNSEDAINYQKDLSDARRDVWNQWLEYSKNSEKTKADIAQREEEKNKRIADKKAEEEKKKKEAAEAAAKAAESSDSSSSSKKKGSGSSKKSSSSSKKSSSGSGKSENGTPKKTGGSSGAKSSKSKSSGSGKSGSSKDSSGKSSKEKESTDKTKSGITRMTDNGKSITYDDATLNNIKGTFSKIQSSESDESSPENNYFSFIKELTANGYNAKDLDEGLELWEMYRETKGKATSKELMSSSRKVAEEEEKNKRLSHGMDVFDEALEHHGILGMKWYVRNGPPYPLGDGDHNAAERKAGWEQSLSTASQKTLAATRKAAEKAGPAIKKGASATGKAAVKAGKATVDSVKKANANSKAKKAAKKEREREAAREEYEKNRKNAIVSGDSKYAREHFNELSNQEINELLGRLDLSNKVDKANHVQTFEDKVDTLMNKVDKARNWVDKGTNAWNSVAKIYNSVNDDKLPVIGQDNSQAKRDAAKKERKEWFESTLKDEETMKKAMKDYTPDEAATAKKYRDNIKSIEKSLNNIQDTNSEAFNAAMARIDELQEELDEIKNSKG